MPKFIFILGSTGSGKSTAAAEIKGRAAELGLSVSILGLDHYYLTNDMIDPKVKMNYDEPNALRTALVAQHIGQLEKKEAIQRPTFNLCNGEALPSVQIDAADLVIIEGIFAGEFIKYLNRNTERLQIYISSRQLNDHFSRKLPRDRDERNKSPEDLRIMKKKQMSGFFDYVTCRMNSANIILENTWQPAAGADGSGNKAVALFNDRDLAALLQFIKTAHVAGTTYGPK